MMQEQFCDICQYAPWYSEAGDMAIPEIRPLKEMLHDIRYAPYGIERNKHARLVQTCGQGFMPLRPATESIFPWGKVSI